MFKRDRLSQVIDISRVRRADIAEKAGISVQTLYNYENGKREPTLDILIKLSRALDTTASYLIGETDDPSPDALKKPLPFTSEEVEAMGFRSRSGSGELADPERMKATHLI